MWHDVLASVATCTGRAVLASVHRAMHARPFQDRTVGLAALERRAPALCVSAAAAAVVSFTLSGLGIPRILSYRILSASSGGDTITATGYQP